MTAQTWTLNLRSECHGPTAVMLAPSDLAGYPDEVPVCEDNPPLSMPFLRAVCHARDWSRGRATLAEKSAELVTYGLSDGVPPEWVDRLAGAWWLDEQTGVMTLVCLFRENHNRPGFVIPREVAP